MNRDEHRYVTTGFAYLAGSRNDVDARDTWYTARDLLGDHRPQITFLNPVLPTAESVRDARRMMLRIGL